MNRTASSSCTGLCLGVIQRWHDWRLCVRQWCVCYWHSCFSCHTITQSRRRGRSSICIRRAVKLLRALPFVCLNGSWIDPHLSKISLNIGDGKWSLYTEANITLFFIGKVKCTYWLETLSLRDLNMSTPRLQGVRCVWWKTEEYYTIQMKSVSCMICGHQWTELVVMEQHT